MDFLNKIGLSLLDNKGFETKLAKYFWPFFSVIKSCLISIKIFERPLIVACLYKVSFFNLPEYG